MPKLLLIGNGYLGQAVGDLFRRHDWTVIPVSLSGEGGAVAADVSSSADVAGLAEQTGAVDFIVHCAASGRGGAEAYRRVYVEGCRNLTRGFSGVPLLFTSSTSVYAQTDGSMVTEESPAEPDRETGRLLKEAEGIVLGADGIVARLAGIYGPGRSVILKKFLNGETVIEEDGRRFLNQIHRDDAALAIHHLATSEPRVRGVFNVSDLEPTSQIDCHRGLAKLFGKPIPPSGPRDPDRKRGWTHKKVSSAKLQALGWKPTFPGFLNAAEEIAETLA
jgi:nucleoside-diphosphate-sugar epimerase